MDANIAKIMKIAGNKNRYQVVMLILTFCTWITVEMLIISLAFLEMMPHVSYKNGSIAHEGSLTYELCKQKYTIIPPIVEHSWVIYFDIKCDKLQTGLIASFIMIGFLFGSFFLDYFTETFGRKRTCIFFSIGYAISTIVMIFAPQKNGIYMEYALSVVSAFCTSIVGLCSYLLMVETIDSKYRSVCGAIINSAFAVCAVIFILLFKYVNSWKFNFIIATVIGVVVCILFMLYAVESPRYWVSKGIWDRFIFALRTIARKNSKLDSFDQMINYPQVLYDLEEHVAGTPSSVQLEEEYLTNESKKTMEVVNTEELREKAEIRATLKELKNLELSSETQGKYGVLALLRYKSQRLNFLILNILWFSCSGIYYGLSIYVKNLPGDIYVNGIIVYVSESISYMLSAYIINIKFFGRKNSVIMFLSFSFIAYIFLVFIRVPEEIETLLAFIARFCIAACFNISYTYSAEIYPSVVRAAGFGFNAVCARVAGIIFPLLLESLGKDIMSAFMVMNILTLLVVFFLPETLGQALKNNLPEEDEVALQPKNEENAEENRHVSINTVPVQENEIKDKDENQ